MGDSQALGQEQLEFLAEPFTPMAQPGELKRDLMLAEGLVGEMLEIG